MSVRVGGGWIDLDSISFFLILFRAAVASGRLAMTCSGSTPKFAAASANLIALMSWCDGPYIITALALGYECRSFANLFFI